MEHELTHGCKGKKLNLLKDHQPNTTRRMTCWLSGYIEFVFYFDEGMLLLFFQRKV